MTRGRSRLARPVALHGLLCAAIVVGAAVKVDAHNTRESYLYLQVSEERLSGRFEIPLAELNQAVGYTGTEREITAANLDQAVGFLQRYARDHASISSPGGPLDITFTGHDLLDAHDDFVLLFFDLGGFDEVPERLIVHYSILVDADPRHRGFLLIEHNWATGTFANENQSSLVFSPGLLTHELELTSSGLWRGFAAVMMIGAEHIWFGFDHLMFLVALLLVAVLRRDDNNRWQPLEGFGPALIKAVTLVTALIAAQTVALSLWAAVGLRLPDRVVEVVIAVSVAFAATNILIPLLTRRVWLTVFGFGLFHGLGFSGGLAELGVMGDKPVLSLLGFILGLGIGQVVVVAVLLPLLYLVRRTRLYQKLVLPGAAWFMILFSLVWLVERALGLKFHMTKRVTSLLAGVMP
jgi:hypothetical protein